jgi:cell fate (sporulation/competence/biofilm development) regulator YlbF (YheA/YmcA/DUF963 family)
MRSFKELVEEYDSLKKELRDIERKKAELMQMYCFPHCPSFGNKIQSQRIDYPSEKYTDKVMQLDDEQNKLEEMLNIVRREISNRLSKITNYKAQDIIKDRIFLGLSFNQIAKKNYLSRVWASNLFWNGMKQVEADEKRNEMGENFHKS